jgi:putative MATE family efflux protein
MTEQSEKDTAGTRAEEDMPRPTESGAVPHPEDGESVSRPSGGGNACSPENGKEMPNLTEKGNAAHLKCGASVPRRTDWKYRLFRAGRNNSSRGKNQQGRRGRRSGRDGNSQKAAMYEAKYFSDEMLRQMIVPLFLEQFLVLLVGMIDTLVVSYAGEAAVSGVSLVNQFNNIFLNLFAALAAGGAVVTSQYIGRGKDELAGESASQLLTASLVFSVGVTIPVLLFGRSLMRLLFGRVADDVMSACMVYLRITALSYWSMAVYNAGAAMYRSIGDTKTTMLISLVTNVINLAGNLIGVFILHAGAAGVAWPTTISRIVSGVWITALCLRRNQKVRYRVHWILRWNRGLMKMILGIAVPNGVENGTFNLVKVGVSSIVALFGTYQIAANGVAQTIWSMSSVMGNCMGTIYLTVIGQCMGARDADAADYYFHKLLRVSIKLSTAWNLFIIAILPLILRFYALGPETRSLVVILVVIHDSLNTFIFPCSGPLGNGLRAAGDVRFTMAVAVISTAGGRLILSYLFGVVCGLGVIGITLAMCADWSVRAVIYLYRLRSGRWKNFQVLKNP